MKLQDDLSDAEKLSLGRLGKYLPEIFPDSPEGMTYKCTGEHGDEYCSPCPRCGGRDRFILNDLGFWCRQCGIKGKDIFDLFHVLKGMAAHTVAVDVLKLKDPLSALMHRRSSRYRSGSAPYRNHAPKEVAPPSSAWQECVRDLLLEAQEKLCTLPSVLSYLYEKRGLTPEIIERASIGFSTAPRTLTRSFAKIHVPSGLLIPNIRQGAREGGRHFQQENIYGVKVRRSDTDVHRYQESRYANISGSKSVPMILNPESSNSTFVVESELDAILLHQESDHSHCIISLGGSNPNVDLETHNLLQHANRIVLALDNDPPGQAAARRLQARHPSAVIRPVPVGKDPSEAYQQGFNLKQWMDEQ